ncbi:Protein of unknown function DUF974 [Carpediemonas membranifera]|uniref:Uncharacterized protein n=1 Tax=Carpediemonas membranifera TaxID=201153 RepID=A0A8J6B2C2_9EUKA|nr:Protein of unknown function DUF974 [Carpediemonas membranifera]|eukprot:KAG9391394.1 Protein of unknown function DUF974 [Carpediemonas membranifera]
MDSQTVLKVNYIPSMSVDAIDTRSLLLNVGGNMCPQHTQMVLKPAPRPNTLYMGEKAGFSICFVNMSAEILTNIELDAFMTTSVRQRLLNESIRELAPGQRLEYAVHKDIGEPVEHTFTSTVVYRNAEGLHTLTSTYKVQSANPLEVKPRSHVANGHAFLEVQIDSKLSVPIYLSAPTIDVGPQYRVLKNHHPTTREPDSIDVDRILLPNDKKRFLFELEPVESASTMPSELGKLRMAWTREMGVRGRLQTKPIYLKR